MAAHRRVVQNGGAAGIDGVTVEELMPHCRLHWERIRKELLGGAYHPAPVRKVEIPKPGGKGVRMLGIPTWVPYCTYHSLPSGSPDDTTRILVD